MSHLRAQNLLYAATELVEPELPTSGIGWAPGSWFLAPGSWHDLSHSDQSSTIPLGGASESLQETVPGASPPKSPPRTQEATGSFLGHSTCLSPPHTHLPSTCCGKAKCCRQPWPFCSPLDLCLFLIRFLIPLWAHCSAYPKPDTSQADERNHRGEQSLHLEGSELAASGRVRDIARYKQQAGAGFGNRKGSLGKNNNNSLISLPGVPQPCHHS